MQSSTANPLHNVPSVKGPSWRVPVFEYTAKTMFTISMKLFGPTSPLGSGG